MGQVIVAGLVGVAGPERCSAVRGVGRGGLDEFGGGGGTP